MDQHEINLALLARIDQRRHQRREIEWRLSLSLWAGEAITARTFADIALPAVESESLVLGVAFAVVLILVLSHAMYEAKFIKAASDGDRDQASVLEKALNGPTDQIATSPSTWAAIFQVGVTAVLGFVVLATLMTRYAGIPGP